MSDTRHIYHYVWRKKWKVLTLGCLGNIKVDNKKDELNYKKSDALDFFATDCTILLN
jgi:hypothetical protein